MAATARHLAVAPRVSERDLAAVRDLITMAEAAPILKVKTTNGAIRALRALGVRLNSRGKRLLVSRRELEIAMAGRFDRGSAV